MKKDVVKTKAKTILRKDSGTKKVGRKLVRHSGSGVVWHWIRTDSSQAGSKALAPSKFIKVIEAGLPVGELDELRCHLDIPMEKLAPMLSISKATLHRRKAAGRLDVTESDRVVRYARLLGKAVATMESVENARRWLAAPQVGLGGAVPLEYAQTEFGAREVENLLGRIEYGVYS
jgi:putative toxin-antitoxin system antitoxin component (TIGR02293 family)